MSTFEALKQLGDGAFHLLADHVLRRLESRYQHLRTHGLNDRAESIKGQPDSYVGDTARSCSIAFCYTVERKRWWVKVVSDIKEARANCISAIEIVVAIPHNVDRDGPPKGQPDWLAEAKAASGAAKLRVIDGRELAEQLDHEQQDLRFEHLGIPFSRVTSTSIFSSTRKATADSLAALAESGRFDSSRYLRRSADHELYRLWQSCLKDSHRRSGRDVPPRLIPLVNDSGVGKTSLICEFARSLGSVLPVLLVQARDVAFDTESALVAHVLHELQGVIDPSLRVGEEAAVVRHLSLSSPLTVIVDGLDETHSPDEVRRALTYWLRSRIGEKSVLIVTSRLEFWRTCLDQHWLRWTAQQEHPWTNDDRPNAIKDVRISSEIRLPDRFSQKELEFAWLKAGHRVTNLFSLDSDARDELRHPFTLRVYIELLTDTSSHPRTIRQVDLMDEWLTRRLDAERDGKERISRNVLQQALRIVATKLADSKGGAISVDMLGDVPRFDLANPPGPVVQRLIEAGILESVPTHPDIVRFTVEAVQDFFHADADIDRIRIAPEARARSFAAKRFTEVHARLMRLARRLESEDVRHQFVETLAVENCVMAAVVISLAPNAYSPLVRAKVAELMGNRVRDRHRAPAAIAISLLGAMGCTEAAEILKNSLFPPAEMHSYLRQLGAEAFVALGRIDTAEFVFRWMRTGIGRGNETYYFRENLAAARRARAEFRHALGDEAIAHLETDSGKPMHARAVYVMALLGDERLIPHLAIRLRQNGELEHYENHALVALGTHDAARLFFDSFNATGKKVAAIGNTAETNTQWASATDPIHLLSADVRYLMTPAFEAQLRRLVKSDVSDIAWLAVDMIRRSEIATLLYDAAEASARHDWMDLGTFHERDVVSAELWLSWWATASDVAVRRRLLRIAPRYPSIEVEEALIAALDLKDFRGQAARLLGQYGSVRALPRLRQLLSEEVTSNERSLLLNKTEIAHAVGDLRDDESVELLREIAVQHPKSWESVRCLENIGVIGTPRAEKALLRMLDDGFDEGPIVSALAACGTGSAMDIVVACAARRSDGAKWVCKQLRRLMFTRGWRRGRYYTHVDARKLVAFLDESFQPMAPKENSEIIRALDQIDSEDIRWLLRRWASREAGDVDMSTHSRDGSGLSILCMSQLSERGDEFALAFAVSERFDEKDDHIYIHLATDRLSHFPAESVAKELRSRLAHARETRQIVRYLSLLGRFGAPSDGDLARPYLDLEDDLLANVACETVLRLEDPLLVPRGWREV